MTQIWLLAQGVAGTTDVSVQATPPWWHVLLEQAFALTLLFIFLTAVVGLVIAQRRRDKCLKLMDGDRVTVLDQSDQALWGTLDSYPKGLEVVFDQSYLTRRGIAKRSALIYEPQMASIVAIIRSERGLSAAQRARRQSQIRRGFRPNPLRQLSRWLRNLLNTLRDAFGKALTALIGQIAKVSKGSVVDTQSSGVDQIGQTLLGAAGNAFEPMLERHVGTPVVLQLKNPLAGEAPPIDVLGFLADYTDKYVAVFNVDHPSIAEENVTVSAESSELVGAGFTVTWQSEMVRVKCTGSDFVVIESMQSDERSGPLEIVLTRGSTLGLRHHSQGSVQVRLRVTRRVDVVCPRSLATVLFGGEDGDAREAELSDESRDARNPEVGLPPEQLVADE